MLLVHKSYSLLDAKELMVQLYVDSTILIGPMPHCSSEIELFSNRAYRSVPLCSFCAIQFTIWWNITEGSNTMFGSATIIL